MLRGNKGMLHPVENPQKSVTWNKYWTRVAGQWHGIHSATVGLVGTSSSTRDYASNKATATK